jgi:hypothetical protein
MLQALNDFVRLVIVKNKVVTFNQFLEYSFQSKQKVLNDAIIEAKFYPKFYDFYTQLYNGTKIHCNIERDELVIFMEGTKNNLTQYKARFDSIKIEILKNKNSILATELILIRGDRYILKISFTVIPKDNMIEFLNIAMNNLR